MIEEDRILPYQPSFPAGRRVLVIAPHPDDDIIGCGGSTMIHLGVLDPVRVVFLTRGDQGDFTGRFGEDYPLIREQEALEAARTTGVQDIRFLPYLDRQVQAREPLIRDLVSVMEDHRAELVYCPSPMEAQPDHREAAFAAWSAVHRLSRAVEVAFYETSTPLKPTILVDISTVMERKMTALYCHRSQFLDYDWSDRVRALARFRTISLIGQAEYAEAFWMARAEPDKPRSLREAHIENTMLREAYPPPRREWEWRVRVPFTRGRMVLTLKKS